MRPLFLFCSILLPFLGMAQADKSTPDSTHTTTPANEKSGGSPLSASLQNRKFVKRGAIADPPEKSGKVVVEICVDNTGTVVSAEYKQKASTTSDTELRDKAITAAKGYRFAPSDQALQCGNLTFNFMLKPKPDIPSDLVFIKGGTFQMGDVLNDYGQNETPVHTVTLSDFYLGKTEVTFDEYDAFCVATGLEKPFDRGWGRGKNPALRVSWYDAVEYCNWRSKQENLAPAYTIDKTRTDLANKDKVDTMKWTVTLNPGAKGYRLPTEAEWEYAAREGGQRVRFGNGKDTADYLTMNYDAAGRDRKPYSIAGKTRGKTTATGVLSKNSLGLFDMSGNVGEWCYDWYAGGYPQASAENPEGPTLGDSRVCRGGAWDSASAFIRATSRFWCPPYFRDSTIGFRLARNY